MYVRVCFLHELRLPQNEGQEVGRHDGGTCKCDLLQSHLHLHTLHLILVRHKEQGAMRVVHYSTPVHSSRNQFQGEQFL